MRKKGMTLIESVVAIALLGVIFLLVAPLINSFGKVKSRVHTQKEIDAEFSVVSEFIQKKVKSAKGISTSGDGVELHLQIPVAGTTTPEGISFTFTDNKLQYSNGTSTESIMENVSDVDFKYQEGIVLYYIDYGKDFDEEAKNKFRTSFKSSASTRIDIQ